MKFFQCVCIQKDDENDKPVIHSQQKRRVIPRLYSPPAEPGPLSIFERCSALDNIWPLDAESKTQEEWTQWCQSHQDIFGQPPIFLDRSFPPLEQSITSGEMDKEIVFLHYNEIYANKNVCVFDTIEPADIIQGGLGDCWFLSSLASLAERPELIKKLFLTTEVNPEGIYQVRLCCHGHWKIFTLDGYFPCLSHNSLAFSKTNEAELWVLLLEKAYAKRFGCYYNLISGTPNHALIDLTGCPGQQINLNPSNEHDMTREQIWQLLLSSESENEMVIATVSNLPEKIGNLRKPMTIEETGLVNDHCYSILDVKEIRGYKLLQMRNPWARKEWQGDFSDKSELWDDDLKVKCDWKDADDGIFWIQWHDFTTLFTNVDVCYIGNDPSTTFQNIQLPFQLYKFADDSHPVHFSVSNVQVRVGDTMAWIGLHQPDTREDGVHSYCDVHALILQEFNDPENFMDPNSIKPIKLLSCVGRNKFFHVNLPEGQYEIICFTSGRNYSHEESSHEATLTLHYLSDTKLKNEWFAHNITDTREENVLEHLKDFTRLYGEKSSFAVTFNFGDGSKVNSDVTTICIKPLGDSDNQLFVWLNQINEVPGYKVTYSVTFSLFLNNMVTFNHFDEIPDQNKVSWTLEGLTNGNETLVSIACKNMQTDVSPFKWQYWTNCSGNINRN